MLSIALAGCATPRPARIEPPAVVAVPLRAVPPDELLRCPVAPDPFPSDGTAVIPAEIREPMIGLATAYAATRRQLRRLIRWHLPRACE